MSGRDRRSLSRSIRTSNGCQESVSCKHREVEPDAADAGESLQEPGGQRVLAERAADEDEEVVVVGVDGFPVQAVAERRRHREVGLVSSGHEPLTR